MEADGLNGQGFVSGHDFSRAVKATQRRLALQVAEKPDVLKGHDFSRAVSYLKSTRPLGPAGCFSDAWLENKPALKFQVQQLF
jgi:hypothetical protein